MVSRFLMPSHQNNHSFKNLLEEIKNSEYEVKEVGEIVDSFKYGVGSITKRLENNGNYPCITCTDIFESPIFFNKFKTFVDIDTIKTKTFVEKGDILIAWNGYSTKREREGFCSYLENDRPLAGNNIYVLHHNQNKKYLIYALRTEEVKRQMSILFTKDLSSVMRIFLKDIKKIKVPIPSLELQEKIANFLFNFSEYEEKLKRELKLRRKQFHFYKEQIFSGLVERCWLRDVGWEIKSIGDFATEIYTGSDVTKIQLGTGDFPAIRIKEIYHSNLKIEKCINFVDPNLIKRKKYCEYGDILLADTSENLEDFGKVCVYLGKDKCLVGNHIIVIRSQQNPKFLSFYLSCDIAQAQIKLLCQKSTIYQLYPKNLKKLEIPLPPLEEQGRIVEILDKFYDLTENPDKGLNNLIKLNQKQYEYYRNLIFDQLKI